MYCLPAACSLSWSSLHVSWLFLAAGKAKRQGDVHVQSARVNLQCMVVDILCLLRGAQLKRPPEEQMAFLKPPPGNGGLGPD